MLQQFLSMTYLESRYNVIQPCNPTYCRIPKVMTSVTLRFSQQKGYIVAFWLPVLVKKLTSTVIHSCSDTKRMFNKKSKFPFTVYMYVCYQLTTHTDKADCNIVNGLNPGVSVVRIV